MTRLSAKIETEVSSLATRSIRNVPTMARPPTSSGSSAATKLRKKISESTNSRGNAYTSAVRRSCSTCVFTSFCATARPADLHAGQPGELVGDALTGVLERVVVGRLERGGEVGRAPVPGDEGARSGGVEARDGGHVRVAPKPGRERVDSGAPPRAADVDALKQHDHAGLAVTGVLQALVGDHALGVGIIGAVRVEPVGHAGAQGARDHEEESRQHERAARAPVGEASEPIHHRRSRSASRAHQSTIHSLDSMPYRSTTATCPAGLPVASIARSCVSFAS